jgi:hypothetical protein
MDFKRIPLGKSFAPLKKEPPLMCRQQKTISFDTFKTKLLMFKDTRRQAQDYIREVLPTLMLIGNPEESAMKLYNSLDGQWLEFDFTTNSLFLCELKKT